MGARTVIDSVFPKVPGSWGDEHAPQMAHNATLRPHGATGFRSLTAGYDPIRLALRNGHGPYPGQQERGQVAGSQ